MSIEDTKKIYGALSSFNNLFLWILVMAAAVELFYYEDALIVFLDIWKILLVYMIGQTLTHYTIAMNFAETNISKMTSTLVANVFIMGSALIATLVYVKAHDPLEIVYGVKEAAIVIGLLLITINYIFLINSVKREIELVLI